MSRSKVARTASPSLFKHESLPLLLGNELLAAGKDAEARPLPQTKRMETVGCIKARSFSHFAAVRRVVRLRRAASKSQFRLQNVAYLFEFIQKTRLRHKVILRDLQLIGANGGASMISTSTATTTISRTVDDTNPALP